jgi:GntR family transcriptional regulator
VSRPRYRVLADRLVDQISRGDVQIGARLPTEFELCAEYGLSRGTVREALRCLEIAGMITRSPAGTTVVATRPVDDYQPSASTPEEVMDLMDRTKLRRPSTGEVVVDAELASRLGVELGSHWYLLAGPLVLRKHPGMTLCWSEHYHPNVRSRETFRGSNYALKDVEGLTMEQVVTAQPLRAELAEALHAEPGSPALIVRRRHLDADGRVVKVSLHTHPGDRYRITTVFRGAQDGE